MSIKSFVVKSVVIGITSSLLALPCMAREQQVPQVTTTKTILKTTQSWDSTPYKSYPEGNPELIVMTYHIPANSALGWHKHFVPNAAYVVSGTLTVEKKNGEKQVFEKGQVVPETIGTIHRGVTGDKPVDLVVFYASSDKSKITEQVKD